MTAAPVSAIASRRMPRRAAVRVVAASGEFRFGGLPIMVSLAREEWPERLGVMSNRALYPRPATNALGARAAAVLGAQA